jgi:Ca2+-binding RTX toxin-like protein
VLGNPIIDEASISYAIVGDTIFIDDIKYYRGDWTVLEMLDLNLIGSVYDLSSAKIIYMELNLGDDYFGGNNYIDIIHGGPGNDTVYGYGNDDLIFGDDGNDFLFGDDGRDVIFGGFGDDLIDGLADPDELWGGPGYDTFCFGRGYSKDVVKDFTLGQDDFFIDKGLVKNFKKLKKVAEKYKGGVLLDFKGSDDLIIEDIKKKDLKKIDFDFFHF